MDIEDSIIDVADAFGPDYTDLAPEGEAHFDPVTVATVLACHILYAVGAGIRDGITEAAKDGTVAVLQATGRHIGDRLIPARIRDFFAKESGPADQAAAPRPAAASLTAAAASVGQLDPAVIAQLVTVTATAVAQALQTAGLKDQATQRVAQTIEAQVRITLTPVA